MAGSNHLMTGLLVLVVALAFVYLVDPTMFGLLKMKQSEGFNDSDLCPDGKAKNAMGVCEGFADLHNATSNGMNTSGGMNAGSPDVVNVVENPNAELSSMDGAGPANFGSAGAPAGCYPRDQLTPGDLLPKDQNSVWAEQNPMGPGSLKGKNFLSAGALIGVNTVGQSLRNANYQLRSEPPNPQIPVSIFNQSTIAPDTNRRPLEIN